MPSPVLLQSGLSVKEAEVYESLLKIGEVPIADLIRETGDHPQIVYRALDKLVGLGLVLVSYRRHRKYIRAEDPNILEKLQEKKLSDIKRGIPDLLALQQGTQDTIVRVNKGNEAIRDLRTQAIEQLQSGDSLYIIGASGDRYYDIMGDLHAELERKRIKKSIWRKLITFTSQQDQIKKDVFTDLTEFRYLSEDFSIPSSTNIFKNTVALIVWEPEPLVVTLESSQIAESYRHYFESLWKAAQP